MNRREFCLTAGLLLAGAAMVRTDEPVKTFRVKKVFLESWDAEIARNDTPQAVSFARKRLEAIRREGCDGLLLVPGRCSASRWLPRFEEEADRLGLTVFVPACLSTDFFRRVQAVQRFDDILLLNGPNDVLGLVLYDVSRCRWTCFMPSGAGGSDFNENAPQLVVARWLDRQIYGEPIR